MNLGDFVLGAVITARFDTDAGGALITLADSPAVGVRKGGGAGTLITAGVTLVVDNVNPGQHYVTINTGADAAYVGQFDYWLELTAGSIAGVSQVGRLLRVMFSIENRPIVRTYVGLAAASLDTQLADLPTNAELATALSAADDAMLAALSAIATTLGNVPAAAAAAIGARTPVAGLTYDLAMRLAAATSGGKYSGPAMGEAGTGTLSDVGASNGLAVAAIDEDANRTAVVVTP